MAPSQTGSSSETLENTPLLAAGGDRATISEPTSSRANNSSSNEGPPHAQEGALRVLLEPVDKAILLTAALQIGFSICAFAFCIASWVLLRNGGNRFGYYDYTLERLSGPMVWWLLISVFVAGFNILRLRRQGRTLTPLLSIIVFGVGGIVIVGAALDASLDIYLGDWRQCNPNLKGGPGDEEDDWYRGTYEECLDWQATYQIISGIYSGLISIAGILTLVIATMFFVKVYEERTPISSREFTGSRFSLPAGQLSFEVAVRWGAPQAREEEQPQGSGDVEGRA